MRHHTRQRQVVLVGGGHTHVQVLRHFAMEPPAGARLTSNGVQAAGLPWPREREGRPFSTCALAFSESWTEQR